jgi:hypothetical protein
MNEITTLRQGTPIVTSDHQEIGHVAEVRDDALRVDVTARPDFWLSLEDVESVSEACVVLGIEEKEVRKHHVAEPVHRSGPVDEPTGVIAPAGTIVPGPMYPYDAEGHGRRDPNDTRRS